MRRIFIYRSFNIGTDLQSIIYILLEREFMTEDFQELAKEQIEDIEDIATRFGRLSLQPDSSPSSLLLMLDVVCEYKWNYLY